MWLLEEDAEQEGRGAELALHLGEMAKEARCRRVDLMAAARTSRECWNASELSERG